MKNVVQYAFTSLLIIVIAVGLYVSKDWNSTTALFPRVIGFPMLALTIIILASEIKNRRRPDGQDIAEGVKFLTTSGLIVKYFGWLIGFAVFIWAIGIHYSIPVYIFTYMKIEGKFSWLKSGLYALGMTALIIILFDYVFRVAWPEGALLRILNI